ncbi:phage tail protein [Acidovorax sp. A1169]|jgi:microcystin-dependent protein|uniref:phage tail protein n=1 Tax=Acidovorax sp. A1169 TaxID=3059524 RepID=UPI002737F728|nr:tail fiber protein [Acidovorax sp. A1169]MDP4078463.1 tail fiber protein [Acidovorax sp. A1169]
MAEPFLAEIRICSFGFAPKGWALCNGQFLPINQNQALFSLLGTTYGGNGQNTFALPNLQGRRPLMDGGGFTLGQVGGADSHTLSQQELPAHSHGALKASTAVGNQASPDNAYLAASNVDVPYTGGQGVLLGGNSGAVTNVGGSQPHENRSPFLVMNFIIALQGIFPSPN